MNPIQQLIQALSDDLREMREAQRDSYERLSAQIEDLKDTRSRFRGGWLVVSLVSSGVISLAVAVASAMIK